MSKQHMHTSSDGDFEFWYDDDANKFMIAMPPVRAMELFCITNHVTHGITEETADHMTDEHGDFARTLREGIVDVIGKVSDDETGENVFDGYPLLPPASESGDDEDEESTDMPEILRRLLGMSDVEARDIQELPDEVRDAIEEEGLTRDNLLKVALRPQNGGSVTITLTMSQAADLGEVAHTYVTDVDGEYMDVPHAGMMKGIAGVMKQVVEQFHNHSLIENDDPDQYVSHEMRDGTVHKTGGLGKDKREADLPVLTEEEWENWWSTEMDEDESN